MHNIEPGCDYTDSKKAKWTKPTVIEVFELMNKAASALNLAAWQDVHPFVGVNDRTFRRWKKNAENTPHEISSIPFRGYALLKTLADQKSYITPVKGCHWNKIPQEYITTSEHYKCPPINVLADLVGKKSLLGLTRKEVADKLNMNSNSLSDQINAEAISFSHWSLLLLLAGMPIERVFSLGQKQREIVEHESAEDQELYVLKEAIEHAKQLGYEQVTISVETASMLIKRLN